DGTTLDDISKQTGVSRFTLYAWFGNKEGLLKAAFGATWEQINQKVMAKLAAEMTLRETLESVLSVVLDFAERRDPIAALFLEFSRRAGVDGQLSPRWSASTGSSKTRFVAQLSEARSIRSSRHSFGLFCSPSGKGFCTRYIWPRTGRGSKPDLSSPRSLKRSCDSSNPSSASRALRLASRGRARAIKTTTEDSHHEDTAGVRRNRRT